jgi:hypothetical protein
MRRLGPARRWHGIITALAVVACSPQSPPSTDGGAPDPDATVPDGRVMTPDAASRPLRVLFIGNSYTYVNDLPRMLARIAATAGTPPAITTDQVVQGGATLHDHWNDGVAQARIAKEQWTHVVLQGQSLEAAYPSVDFAAMAPQLGAVITAAGARPGLFVTWARAAGDASYNPAMGSFFSPEEMQDRITYGYDDVARKMPGSILSCVGEAFRAALRDQPQIVLHQADRSHPTVAGTYLAASTFYVALTGNPVPPASEVPPEVSAEDAKVLRAVALVGSTCTDIQLKGIVSWQYCATKCKPFDFGVAGTPIAQTFFLSNTGYATAGVADALTLAPPFAWTSGTYPGGSGTVSPTNLPFCSATLAPRATCVLSVTYSGVVEASGALTVKASTAYNEDATRALHGSPTTRALLTVSEDSGFFGSTDASTSGLPALVSAPVGGTTTRSFVVSNRGAMPTTALKVGTPLSAPFSWGMSGTTGTFPGGSGKGQVDGVTYDYCATQALAAGQQCMVTVLFSPPSTVAPGDTFKTAIHLVYADAAGLVSPAANRKLRGYIAVPMPRPPRK